MLNGALAEEWLAYYQYWIGARVMEGPMRSEVEAELLKHADEELEHAEMVAERIIQLGGTPVTNPADWTKYARCAYEDPTDPYIERILEQNLAGERCAIQRYQEIANFTAGRTTPRIKWPFRFCTTNWSTKTISKPDDRFGAPENLWKK